MNTEELIATAESLVKELRGRINGGGIDLQEAEAKILEIELDQRRDGAGIVVSGLDEPTAAITVGVAVFERVRNLRFINRFGEAVVQPRLATGTGTVPEAWRRWMKLGIDVLRILTADDVPDLHAGRG